MKSPGGTRPCARAIPPYQSFAAYDLFFHEIDFGLVVDNEFRPLQGMVQIVVQAHLGQVIAAHEGLECFAVTDSVFPGMSQCGVGVMQQVVARLGGVRS